MRKRMSRREWFLFKKLQNVERQLKKQAERAKQREAIQRMSNEIRARHEKEMDEKYPGWRLDRHMPRSRGRGGFSGSYGFLTPNYPDDK